MTNAKRCTILYGLICFNFNVLLIGQNRYNLQQCIDIAIQHNEGLESAHLHIEYQKQNKKNSGEIPKTNVVYTQGQFNSIYKYDENITVSQSIPFPTVFSNRASVARSQVLSSEYHYEAVKQQLVYEVKTTYYSLLYFKSLYRLLKKEDSIYHAFSVTVGQKHSDGKGTLLEKIAAETQAMEIKNEMLQSEDDINSHLIQLKTLMNTLDDFIIEEQNIVMTPLEIRTDSALLGQHPLLKHLNEQVIVHEKSVNLEKSKILPEFSFSYFNQTIYGPANIFGEDYFLTKRNRLQGVVVGVALPLWYFPQRSKIESARINAKLARSDYDYNFTLLHGQQFQAMSQYIKYRKSMQFYQQNSLTSSNYIVEQAESSFKKGEITYVDFMQILSHALTIERNYLNIIHQNNMAVLRIEYLSGQ